jgi:Tfp pilus assembly protein PilW
MISLTLGLFLIAGALAVFMAAATTGARKEELDRALEGFRYSGFSLSRVIRQSSSINSTSTASSLSVTLPASVENCDGSVSGSAQTNVFSVSAGALRCSVGGGTSQSLVEGIHTIAFTYGVDRNSDKRVAQSEYLSATDVTSAEWARVTGVRVVLTLRRSDGSAGLQESFVITSRKKALDIAQGTTP